mmetsp:Transcript_25032/g.68778  ORF Transcript_25032/g.68778 Transcript_25032/m.68778 type:complete len:249 (-) Transcript_25032:201-947(-)
MHRASWVASTTTARAAATGGATATIAGARAAGPAVAASRGAGTEGTGAFPEQQPRRRGRRQSRGCLRARILAVAARIPAAPAAAFAASRRVLALWNALGPFARLDAFELLGRPLRGRWPTRRPVANARRPGRCRRARRVAGGVPPCEAPGQLWLPVALTRLRTWNVDWLAPHVCAGRPLGQQAGCEGRSQAVAAPRPTGRDAVVWRGEGEGPQPRGCPAPVLLLGRGQQPAGALPVQLRRACHPRVRP